MTTRYKLTTANGTTYDDTPWGPGVTHEAPGTGELCTEGWIHVYAHPLLAVLLDPIHGRVGPQARLWRCECSGASQDDHGLKEGWQHVTTVEEMPLPVVSASARVRFGILCALAVYQDEAWLAWTRTWLNGTDRSATAAYAAYANAHAAAHAAEAADANAHAAAHAAAAAYAAHAAVYAADAANVAAHAADIDLIALAERAVREEAELEARTKENP